MARLNRGKGDADDLLTLVKTQGNIFPMPRKARIDIPGLLQHLMVRGIERSAYLNRLSLTDPLGRTTRYTYNQLGRLSGLETPAGSFSFSYDSLGRRTALTFPNGLYSAATFDAASNCSLSQ